MKYAWQLQKPKEIGSRTHRHPQPQPTQRLDWQCVRLSIPLYVSLYLYLCLPEINMTAMPTRESKLGCDVFKQNSMRSYLIEGRNKCSSFLSTVSSHSLSLVSCLRASNYYRRSFEWCNAEKKLFYEGDIIVCELCEWILFHRRRFLFSSILQYANETRIRCKRHKHRFFAETSNGV